MPPQSRRKGVSVTQHLIENSQNYSFFQAVRLLERAAVCARKETENENISTFPVAHFTPPGTEALRFRSYQALKFPGSELHSVKTRKTKTENEQWEMLINFLGLTGSTGVMPYHYTEMILQRLKQKDESMMHFFDVFNHRSISLFFQANTKYSLPIEYERNKLNSLNGGRKKNHDTGTHALLSLIGLGTDKLEDKLLNKSQSIVFYSGLFNKQIRSSSGLKHILQHQFGIKVEIKEFVGQWQQLIDDVRTRLPWGEQPLGQNACLGRSVMLGQQGWFAQGKIQIVLGPLNRKQLSSFAPGTKALRCLNEIVRLYVGMELNYEFIIRVNRSDIPDKIQLNCSDPPVIGWNSWLCSHALSKTIKSRTLDITVSSNRLD